MIFIIGYPGSGKTTFGRALARKCGIDFIDLDFYIEQRFRKSIPELFAERGEEGFRILERNMLREVAEFENTIVACGGGTPCFYDNMDLMLSRGTVVCIEATEECLLNRLSINTRKRPLLQNKSRGELLDAIRKGLADRAPFYSRANIIFGGDELENSRQIDNSINGFLTLYPDLITH